MSPPKLRPCGERDHAMRGVARRVLNATVPRIGVDIAMRDGDSTATLHLPEGGGPWPAVLVFPDVAADRIRAAVYVAGATDDPSFHAEQAKLMETALAAAGVEYTVECYPARHGFAVPDHPAYDAVADDRHWRALSITCTGTTCRAEMPTRDDQAMIVASNGVRAVLTQRSPRDLPWASVSP
jgi:Dienelactone hydrolase family